MHKINILFLMLSLDVGGTEKHVLNLISHINREKFNPVVCCLYDLGVIGKMFANNKDGIQVYSHLIRSKYDLSGIRRGLKIIRDENIHILYTINSPLTQFWGTVIAKFAGIEAFVTRVARTRPTYHAKRRRIVNRIMLPYVDKVIAQACSQKEYLVRSEGFKLEKIETIYNGVDLEEFDRPLDISSLKRTIRISGDVPVIGMVARLSAEKGHRTLLKAAKKISSIIPEVQFLLAGDGRERTNLEELSNAMSIQSNVLFLGSRNDITEIISIFDVAVMPSDYETFSNAILEYMAASKPVVATNAGSTAEMVVDGDTGFLVPVGDHEALADAILKLLKDKGLAKKMGEAGRERIKEKFTIQKMVTNYESLFQALIKKKYD